MGAVIVRWAMAASLFLAVVGLAARVTEPDLPHEFMEDEDRCGGCHQVEKDGEDWILDPHIFTVSVLEACRSCHPADELGRSHPVGTDPYRALNRKEMPPELPLHWSDDARSEVMTCGTCHNPHLPRFSAEKLYARQRPHGEEGRRYLTYYLRIRGKTPREGFTPLCHACHPGL